MQYLDKTKLILMFTMQAHKENLLSDIIIILFRCIKQELHFSIAP